MEPPTSSEPPETRRPKPYKYVPRRLKDRSPPKWEPKLIIGTVVGIFAAVIVGLLIARQYAPSQPGEAVPTPEARLPSVTQWTDDPGLSIAPAFSHDGKLIAYASDRANSDSLSIWLRPFPSGDARRLTTQAFNDSNPDFSPDDTRIVYRSERDGGGVYITSLSGNGQPRLLAAGGLRPRFSPDGKWIAYYDLGDGGAGAVASASRVFIVSPDGGQPKQVQPGFLYASFPVWSPDGRYLLFEGSDAGGSRDWWVTPPEIGRARPTHALQALSRFPGVHAPEHWWRDRILYSATEQQYPHLWEIPISTPDLRISGRPRQLTNGDAMEQVSAVGKGGRLVFTRMRVTQDVWSIPVDAKSGVAAGQMQQITSGGVNQAPSIAADGARLVYISNKTGVRDIWVRESDTAFESALTSFTNIGTRPSLSFDGHRIAYPATNANGECAVVVTGMSRESKPDILKGCFDVWGWSPDGLNLVISTPARDVSSVEIFSIGSGERRPLLSPPRGHRFFDAAFAPAGSWVTFTAGKSPLSSQVYVAPYRGTPIQESAWIPITQDSGSFAAWSPDGGALYFRSSRDGFQCVWSQKLDSGMRPAGAPVAVQHFHSVAFGPYMVNSTDYHLSVAKDRLTMNLAKGTANLWVATLE